MDDETRRMHERQRGTRPGPFTGHSFWWWASAAVFAVAVVGSLLLVVL